MRPLVEHCFEDLAAAKAEVVSVPREGVEIMLIMVQATAQVMPPSLANFRVQVAESTSEASRTAPCADVKDSTEVKRRCASTRAMIRTTVGCDTLPLCKASRDEQAIAQDAHENVVGMRSARSFATCAGLSHA